MKICFVTSEVAPFAKTGGLADVSSALARRLHDRGHDVRLLTPLYPSALTASTDLESVEGPAEIPIHGEAGTSRVRFLAGRLPGSGLRALLLQCPELYDRPSIYTNDPDEALRFAVLCRAAIEHCQRTQWAPDVFHCHDWHTAPIPLYLKGPYAWDSLFRRSRTVLTIHNLGYQGVFPAHVLPPIGLAGHGHLLDAEDLRAGRVGFLKNGILKADEITTVSPTYAREIQTVEHGFGLERVLRARRSSLTGILNGVDYAEWSPEHDPHLSLPYSAASLERKDANRDALLQSVGLGAEAGVAVFGVVSRLAHQKGLDLVVDVLPDLIGRRDVRLVVLGTGEEKYEADFRSLEREFPANVRFRQEHDEPLAHRIEAGSDFFLMPSRYEPCGLNQMYSLRYGTIPIVRKTGGLADTVRPFDPATGDGTGFLFEPFTGPALRWAIEEALETYRDAHAWTTIRRNAMAQDFSWDHQVVLYENLYRGLVARSGS
jgi:starch synthase